MDLIDKKILSLLQRDASLPLTTIAKKVGLSTTPCFNRIKKLEEDGFEVFKFVRRDVKAENEIFWSPSKQEIDIEKFQTLDAIIHLAGESLAPKDIFGFLPLSGGRWN